MNYKESNTKYARLKRRKEFEQEFANKTKDERRQINTFVFIVIFIICIVIYLLTDLKTLAKWASH